jgi:hypothetical protein
VTKRRGQHLPVGRGGKENGSGFLQGKRDAQMCSTSYKISQSYDELNYGRNVRCSPTDEGQLTCKFRILQGCHRG